MIIIITIVMIMVVVSSSLILCSLKSRGTDFVTFLGDLGKEQKFEVSIIANTVTTTVIFTVIIMMVILQVTYNEVDEKSDDDLTQCLVQLSTLPAAVINDIMIITISQLSS